MARRPSRLFVAVALAVAVGIATAVAPFASSSPDGLTRVAHDHGFSRAERVGAVQQRAPLRDYAAPATGGDERVRTGVAGFAGTLAAFALAWGAGVVVRRRARSRGAGPAARSAVP